MTSVPQESDILESPSIYCRSNLGDKISDYEDLWTQENNNAVGAPRGGPVMSSFRPLLNTKKPDLIQDSRKFDALLSSSFIYTIIDSFCRSRNYGHFP